MKRIAALVACIALIGVAASTQDAKWITIVDGKTMGDFGKVGAANWRIEGGALVADKLEGKDPSYLVTKEKYKDFQIQAEFWADEDVNSGIFIRCKSATVINAKDCYEVNIFDKRPDPTYGTGAIVDVAKVVPMPKAAGKWNTYDITARGTRLTVLVNGMQTVNADDSKHAREVIALQYGAGTVKFRNVRIRTL